VNKEHISRGRRKSFFILNDWKFYDYAVSSEMCLAGKRKYKRNWNPRLQNKPSLVVETV
jgi:hypothetical protein